MLGQSGGDEILYDTMMTMMAMVKYLIEVIHEIEGQGGDNKEKETMIHCCKSVTSQQILKTLQDSNIWLISKSVTSQQILKTLQD